MPIALRRSALAKQAVICDAGQRTLSIGKRPLAGTQSLSNDGKSHWSHNAKFPLAAGMQLTAEIIEGRRTVLEYLLSPVQRVLGEAGRER